MCVVVYYIIINSKEKISDIIERAGGILPQAQPESSIFRRNGVEIQLNISKIINSRKSKYDLELQDGDAILINKKTDLVSLEGEVRTPGLYKYLRGMRAYDLIKTGGGLSVNAEKKDITNKKDND